MKIFRVEKFCINILYRIKTLLCHDSRIQYKCFSTNAISYIYFDLNITLTENISRIDIIILRFYGILHFNDVIMGIINYYYYSLC